MGALAVSGLRPISAPVTGVVIPGGLPAPILGEVSPGGGVRFLVRLLTEDILVSVLGRGWMLAVFRICATSSKTSVLDSCVLSRSILMHVHPGGAVHLFRSNTGPFVTHIPVVFYVGVACLRRGGGRGRWQA